VLSNRGEGSVSARPNGALPAAPRAPTPAPTEAVAAWIPVAKLREKPRPPSLDTALRQNYPPQHRRSGTAGSASVELTLSERGSVLNARVSSESAAGFGEACRQTLLPSRWSAPLDQAGRAVKTRVTYRCKFTVGG
jgi:TonB family protein